MSDETSWRTLAARLKAASASHTSRPAMPPKKGAAVQGLSEMELAGRLSNPRFLDLLSEIQMPRSD